MKNQGSSEEDNQNRQCSVNPVIWETEKRNKVFIWPVVVKPCWLFLWLSNSLTAICVRNGLPRRQTGIDQDVSACVSSQSSQAVKVLLRPVMSVSFIHR